MSRKEAIRACYPKARKAVKVAGEVVKTVAGGLPRAVIKEVKRRKTKKEIMSHKPPKMEIRPPKKRKPKKIKRVKRTRGY